MCQASLNDQRKTANEELEQALAERDAAREACEKSTPWLSIGAVGFSGGVIVTLMLMAVIGR